MHNAADAGANHALKLSIALPPEKKKAKPDGPGLVILEPPGADRFGRDAECVLVAFSVERESSE
jgi:hypothetical protein